MKRTGERCQNKWKQISWKEAMNEMGSKLEEIK